MGPPRTVIEPPQQDVRPVLKRKAESADFKPSPIPSRPSVGERTKSSTSVNPGKTDMTPTSTPVAIPLGRRLMAIVNGPTDDDMLTNVSINGDGAVEDYDHTDPFKVTELCKTFPSVVTVYTLLRKNLIEMDVQQCRLIIKHFFGQVLTALDAMDELPRSLREDPSYEGGHNSVRMFLQLLDQDIAGLPDKFRVETPNEIKRKFAPIISRIDMLRRAFEIFIRRTNTLIKKHPDAGKERSLIDIAESYFKHHPGLVPMPADDMKSLLSEIIMCPPSQLHNITCSPTVLQDAGRSEMTFEYKRFLLSQQLLKCFMLQEAHRAAVAAEKNKPRTHVHGASISSQFVSAQKPITPEEADSGSTGGSLKNILQAMKRKDAAKPGSPPKEEPVKFHKSMLMVDDPMKKNKKIEILPPVGEAANLASASHGVKSLPISSIVYFVTLSSPDKYVPELTTTIFTCFRLFTTPAKLLTQLVARYDEVPDKASTNEQLLAWVTETANVRVRIVDILETWLRHYWHPDQDNVIIYDLIFFVHRCVSSNAMSRTRATGLIDAICQITIDGDEYRPLVSTRKQKADLEAAVASLPTPPPTDFRFQGQFSFDLCLGNPAGMQEVARQITLLASDVYSQLNTEVLVKYWLESGDLSEEMADRIHRAVRQDTLLACLVQYDILLQPTPEKRARRIEMWIDIAEHCLGMRNFWGAHAIITSCAGSSIRRLRQTALAVALAYRTKWFYLDDLFHVKNYAGYRRMLKEKKLVPTIPLLSALVHDVVHSYEWEAKDKQTDGLFDIHRAKLTHATMTDMEDCRIPYKFLRNNAVRDFIQSNFQDFISRGLVMFQQELVYKHSDKWAGVENYTVPEKGDKLWLVDVPGYEERNRLAYIFPRS